MIMDLNKELISFIKEKKEASVVDVSEHFKISSSIAGKNLRYLRRTGLLDSKNFAHKKLFYARTTEVKRMSLDEFLKGEINE